MANLLARCESLLDQINSEHPLVIIRTIPDNPDRFTIIGVSRQATIDEINLAIKRNLPPTPPSNRRRHI